MLLLCGRIDFLLSCIEVLHLKILVLFFSGLKPPFHSVCLTLSIMRMSAKMPCSGLSQHEAFPLPCLLYDLLVLLSFYPRTVV